MVKNNDVYAWYCLLSNTEQKNVKFVCSEFLKKFKLPESTVANENEKKALYNKISRVVVNAKLFKKRSQKEMLNRLLAKVFTVPERQSSHERSLSGSSSRKEETLINNLKVVNDKNKS